MAYIQLPIAEELGREFPGILGPMTFRPETAAPLNELVNVLLRGVTEAAIATVHR
jgi:hypothetical protein